MMPGWGFILPALVVLMTQLGRSSGFTVAAETALKKSLFNASQYDPSVRPNSLTTVSLTLVPTSLNSIDIKAQTMSISGWWVMSWKDDRLRWNASQHDHINETHAFQDEIWTPTIVVYNSVNDLTAIDEDTIPVRIMSSGQMEWNPPGILTVSCSTDITHFPFDQQTCGVSVKTFGYTLDQLVLEADVDEIDMTYYSISGEWSLLDTWTLKQDIRSYSQVTFNFRFERKPDFYGLNLILPVVMMSVMSVCIFILPPDSGEKMGYSLTVMLTFVLLMTLLAGRMPTTADHTSYFEVYVILVLTLCSLAVGLSIISLNLYSRESSQTIPPRLRDLTHFLSRLLCQKNNRTAAGPLPTSKHGTLFVSEKEEVAKQSREQVVNNNNSDDAKDEAEVTWKKVSLVLDAFLFRVYTVTVLVLTTIFLSIVAAG